MKVRQLDGRQAFAGQRRPTSGAKSPPRSPRRGIELGYLALGNPISLGFEGDEDRNRRPGMLSAALAMTPIYPLCLTSRDKTDRTAKAPTSALFDYPAHDLIL